MSSGMQSGGLSIMKAERSFFSVTPSTDKTIRAQDSSTSPPASPNPTTMTSNVADMTQLYAPDSVVIAAPAPQKPWTCRVSAFGRTFVKTLPTLGETEAHVLKECAADSAEMHCQKMVCSQ